MSMDITGHNRST